MRGLHCACRYQQSALIREHLKMLFLRVCMLYATIEKTKTDTMKTGAFDENKDSLCVLQLRGDKPPLDGPLPQLRQLEHHE